MAFPPCARDVCPPRLVRTVVVKIGGSKNAVEWAGLQTGVGQTAQAVALVLLDEDEDTPVGYIVLTQAKPDTLANVAAKLRKKLQAPPIEAEVEWIRALDRRLTKLFGWGDVWMDGEQVSKAVSRNDTSELSECFPMLRNVISRPPPRAHLLPPTPMSGVCVDPHVGDGELLGKDSSSLNLEEKNLPLKMFSRGFFFSQKFRPTSRPPPLIAPIGLIF